MSSLKVTEIAASVSTAPDEPSVLFETTVGCTVPVMVEFTGPGGGVEFEFHLAYRVTFAEPIVKVWPCA